MLTLGLMHRFGSLAAKSEKEDSSRMGSQTLNFEDQDILRYEDSNYSHWGLKVKTHKVIGPTIKAYGHKYYKNDQN